MPKLRIRDFSGGLVTNRSDFDLADNEYKAFTNVKNKKPGLLERPNSESTVSPSGNGLDTQAELVSYRTEKDDDGDNISTQWWLYANSNYVSRFDQATYLGVRTVDDLTPTPSGGWQTGQTHTSISQTSTNGSGSGLTVDIVTDGLTGNPTFTIVKHGSGYAVDDQIVFTDPGSTSNTATLVVATNLTWSNVNEGWTGASNPDILIHNQVARLSDGSFTNNSKWYGHIKRDFLGNNTVNNKVPKYYDISYEGQTDAWTLTDTTISAPQVVKMTMAHDGGNDLSNDHDVGIFVYEPRHEYGTSGVESDEHNAWDNALDNDTFDAADKYAFTYMYDYIQESELSRDADGNIGVSGFEVKKGDDEEVDSNATLSADLGETTSSFYVSDYTVIKKYTYIKIDNEIMFVTDLDPNPYSTDYQVVVRRGQKNTKYTTHSSGAVIYNCGSPQKARAINVVIKGLTSSGYHNKRITGINLYWQPKNDPDWYLVESFDMNRGYADSPLASSPETGLKFNSNLLPYFSSNSQHSAGAVMNNFGYWMPCPSEIVGSTAPSKGAVVTVDTITPTPSSAWQASQEHGSVSQTSTSGSGTGINCRIKTDSDGNPTFTFISGGSNYVIDDTIVFTDPGSTSNTATLTVESIDGLSYSSTAWTSVHTDFSSSTNDIAIATKHEPGDSGVSPQFNRIGSFYARPTSVSSTVLTFGTSKTINRVSAPLVSNISAHLEPNVISTHTVDVTKATTWYVPYDGLKLATYNTLTGRAAKTKVNNIKWNTAAVVNNRAYYGNIDTNDDNDQTVREQNRIYYTDPYKLDEILPTKFLDVGLNDGDNIVKLCSYRNRLYVFKSRNTYIYDSRHRLERVYVGVGAIHKHAVFETPVGLVCANKQGVFAITSNNKQELSFKIRDTYQALTFEQTMLGYDGIENELLLIPDSDATTMYVMNLDNGSWGIRSVISADNRSNFVISSDFRAQYLHID